MRNESNMLKSMAIFTAGIIYGAIVATIVTLSFVGLPPDDAPLFMLMP